MPVNTLYQDANYRPVSGGYDPVGNQAGSFKLQNVTTVNGNTEGDIGVAIDSGSITSTPVTSSTATQTSVAALATDTTLLASNTSRKGATFEQDGTSTLYLLLGAGPASTSVYTIQILPGGYYEVPYNYTGVIHGICSSATGNVRITELT